MAQTLGLDLPLLSSQEVFQSFRTVQKDKPAFSDGFVLPLLTSSVIVGVLAVI